MKPNATKTDFLSTLPGILTAAVAANLLWGSAAPCIKLGYQYFAIAGEDTLSQILFAGVRFSLAGALTILIGSLLRRRLLLPKRGSGWMILTLAMMQTVIQYTFFYIGLSHAPGYKGSIISPTSTFFALLIAALVFRQEKLTAKKLLGCLIGFAGVVVVSVTGGLGGGVRLTGEGFLVLAAASYGCSSVLIKRYSSREDPVVLSGWQFLLGGLLMTAVALLGGGRLHANATGAWPLMLYLSFLSAVAYTLWSLLLQRHPVSRIMVFSFLNPVFGVVLSALLLGEGKILNIPRCALAMGLVCLGVWIVNRPAKQPETP
ncbi:MAG: DMT family transporter [Oscillospiraceae bacterium]|nr:DMT family transporter [Oscillospiraceae bacterium]